MHRLHGRVTNHLFAPATALRIGTVCCLALLGGTAIKSLPSAEPKPSVFDLPAFQAKYAALQHQFQTRLAERKFDEAEKLCRDAVAAWPADAGMHYNLACTLARQGKLDEAIAALEKAVALGFDDAAHLAEDDDLAALHGRAAFQKIAKAAAAVKAEEKPALKPPIEAAAVSDGVAPVGEANTLWDPRANVFRSVFKFADKPTRPIAKGLGRVGDLLRQWDAEHSAAGNHGDLYDNNDRGHSLMDYADLPQLSRVAFCETARRLGVDYGSQLFFIFAAPTLGNSSTALTVGPKWRCQGRIALTLPRGPQTLYAQYVSNQLYVYPEHCDHRAGHNGADGKGYGDLLPVNVPYYILSQGSSGSDRVFLDAVAATMAAFRPEVKAVLVRTGTLMPTVQMIFRSCNAMVAQPDDYLTGRAHPSVFEGSQVSAERMVTMAHAMTAGVLPPMVQMEVLEEDAVRPGVDCFDPIGERFFDTPCAIARVARATKYARRLVISAAKSRDLGGRALEYRWVVLQGDKERIRIRPRNPANSVVELTIGYHPRRPVQPGSDMESNRVDVGLFVSNGTYYSAPGFVSVLFLDNQLRSYDAQQRIQAIDYADPLVGKNYVDPLLDARENWRDEYQYDSAGRLLGWTRTRHDAGDKPERFTADGALVTKTDAQGRPIEARRVRYAVAQGKDPVLTLSEQTGNETVHYAYDSAEDRVGHTVEK